MAGLIIYLLHKLVSPVEFRPSCPLSWLLVGVLGQQRGKKCMFVQYVAESVQGKKKPNTFYCFLLLFFFCILEDWSLPTWSYLPYTVKYKAFVINWATGVWLSLLNVMLWNLELKLGVSCEWPLGMTTFPISDLEECWWNLKIDEKNNPGCCWSDCAV